MHAPVRSGIELLGTAVGLALIAVVVLTLTGSMAWVITTGVSMQPQFEEGDLAVVRPAAAYDVGDVIAYRNRDLDRIVLHRVVDVVDGRLVTRGDSNDWIDSYRPTPDEVLGRLSAHLPGLGRASRVLLDPAVAAGAVFGGTVLLLGASGRPRGRPRRSSTREAT